MGVLGLLLTLALGVPVAATTDLACDAFIPGGPEGTPVAIVIKMDAVGNVSIPMPNGPAVGKLEDSADSYRGYVARQDGKLYWAYFDRYRGTFVVAEKDLPSGGKATIWGDCKLASQRF